MKKTLLTTLFALISMFTYAQVPYFAKAPGDKNLYGDTSAKFRPGINNIESYTTFQYGITDYMALGTDVYTGGKEAYWGFMLRGGYKVNKWFGIGGTATPSFDLGDNFKFSYFTGGLFMNGAITKDENFFWCTNTWFGVNRDATYTINQFSYLGYAFKIKNGDYITPMVGMEHDWKFGKNPDVAAGFYYTHGIWNFYVWGDKFCQKNPRFVVGIDFKLPTKL